MTIQDIEKSIGEVIENDPELKRIVRSVSVFGSHATGKENEESDVDFLIDFNETPGFFTYAGIQIAFEKKLHTKVDLRMEEGLSKFIKKKVLHDSRKVYG